MKKQVQEIRIDTLNPIKDYQRNCREMVVFYFVSGGSNVFEGLTEASKLRLLRILSSWELYKISGTGKTDPYIEAYFKP